MCVDCSSTANTEGTDGTNGLYGGYCLKWKFDATSVAANPSSQYLRLNNATYSSATILYISDTSADSVNAQAYLQTWDDTGSTSLYGYVKISKEFDSSIYAIYKVLTSVTDSGTYHTITISHISSAGTFATNDNVVVCFTPVGPAGGAGDPGIFGGFSGEWLFDTATTSGPASTFLRFNNATYSSVTNIFINDTNSDSISYNAFLNSFDDTRNYGFIRIFKETDSTKFWLGEITGVTDNGPDHTLAVTHIASNSTFSASDSVIVTFTATGEDGLGYDATTSSTSLTIGTGSKSLTVSTYKAFIANASRVRIANSTTNYMDGIVTAYTASTGAMTVTVDRIGGSGTLASWNISLIGDVPSTDSGWINLNGFSFLSALSSRPQYRVINKTIHFRGTAVIPLDNGGAVLAYSSEASYAQNATVTPCTAAVADAVTVNAAGSITFNAGAAAISDSTYYPDQSYSTPYTIALRRVKTSTSTEEVAYTAPVILAITSGGVLSLGTLRDLENYSGTATIGASDLRKITSNVTSGDYITNWGSESVGAVAQATNVTTAVTLNRRKGVITTQAASAAADASHTFTVNNTLTTVNSVILLTITNYSGTIGTNGNPTVIVDNKVAATSFDIIITNTHSANALNGTLTIAYEIIPAHASLTHQVTLDAAEPAQLGGFEINLSPLKAYLA